jgi:hypothetical protein
MKSREQETIKRVPAMRTTAKRRKKPAPDTVQAVVEAPASAVVVTPIAPVRSPVAAYEQIRRDCLQWELELSQIRQKQRKTFHESTESNGIIILVMVLCAIAAAIVIASA